MLQNMLQSNINKVHNSTTKFKEEFHIYVGWLW